MTSSLDNIPAPGAVTDDLDLSGLAPLHPLLPHVVMYTQPACTDCNRFKILFKAARLPVVAVPLDADSDAYRLFTAELGVKRTPIILIHNTFQETAYFDGFDSDRAKIAINSVFARLKILEGAAEPLSVDLYLTDLLASIDPKDRPAFIRPAVFAEMAAKHLAHEGVLPPRSAAPKLLSTSRSEAPSLLR